MNKRGMRTPQPQARRPSQRRLTDEQVTLPARLVHLRHLPWLGCYQRQLQTENKSDNTQKSYFYGLRPLIETVLPGAGDPGELARRIDAMLAAGQCDGWRCAELPARRTRLQT